jgi:hypothetical protein
MSVTTPATPKKIEWRATRQTGIGHAFTGKGPALCGEPNQPEKFDWPRRDRCVDCDEKARA